MMLNVMKKHSFALLVLIIISGADGIYSTRHGISMSMDSVWYVAYARSVQAGNGFTAPMTSWQSTELRTPITQWPPGYPAMLALTPDPEGWSHLLSILSLVLSTLLTYALTYRLCRSAPAAFIAGLLFLMLPSVVGSVFALAHSEAPFTVLSLLILHMLLFYRRGRDVSLWAAVGMALLIALATMTRYLGVAFGLLSLQVMLWWAWGGALRRYLHLIIAAAGFIPLTLYMLYLRSVTGSFTGVQTTQDSLSINDIPDTVRTVLVDLLHGFIFPFNTVGLLSNFWGIAAAAVVGLVIAVLLWRHRQPLRDTLNAAHVITILFVVAYLIVFWGLSVRSDVIVGSAQRHYVVLMPALLALTVTIIKLAKVPLWANVLLVALFTVSGTAALIENSNGHEYNAPSYRNIITPQVTEILHNMPDNTLVHSMHVGYLSLMLGDTQPIRIFSGDAITMGYECTELIVPDDFDYALFIAIEEQISVNGATDAVRDTFAAWAEPCGELVSVTGEHPVVAALIEWNGN